jgi:Ca2+-binding RTX toxin-like protein
MRAQNAEHDDKSWRGRKRRLLAGIVLVVGAVLATSPPASAAVTASFGNGVLTVVGDAADNSIVVSRNAAGRILVNNGAITVVGRTPTVANTARIQVSGRAGDDVISLDETNGALPLAHLSGGGGGDTVTGGSGGDQLFGQPGSDTLLGMGGVDLLFGGMGRDTLTGGDADDQAFGENGDDRMIWNPGDDTDLNEGGGGTDTVEVSGGSGGEQFSTTANGARVRFDRLSPAPFALDIGTSERLDLNANGGDDSFSASGNLAALIQITVDGGADDDTILGSNGIDRLLGGDGDDFIDGQQGDDVAFLRAGDDVFQWDPGDGSDTVEGQDGLDTLRFNGSNASEVAEVSANGGRARFTRNVGNIVMDLDGVERIESAALGGADTLIVRALDGTDVAAVANDLAAAVVGSSGDGQSDRTIVDGTNGDDAITVVGDNGQARVFGLAAEVTVAHAEPARDTLVINALAGGDVVDGTALTADAIGLVADGGGDDDVLLGGDGNDVLLGGAGDDVLLGGRGQDVLDGGAGDNVVIQD